MTFSIFSSIAPPQWTAHTPVEGYSDATAHGGEKTHGLPARRDGVL